MRFSIITCDECGREFDNKKAYTNHYRWHNNKMQRKIFAKTRRCKICGKLKNLKQFIAVYREKQDRLYYGYYCKKCTSQKYYEYRKEHSIWSKERNRLSYERWKLKSTGGKCYICGENRTLDIAHIIPRKGKSRKRLEPLVNLIGLCPTHHRLFDEGKLNDEEYNVIKDKVNKAMEVYHAV